LFAGALVLAAGAAEFAAALENEFVAGVSIRALFASVDMFELPGSVV
jgi:hypothetical protein